ncbi:MAG: energy-coupling factor transporter ATPase [Ruminococcaceae bacterium]|nr:energy-coupling factor transporter ATPase [Oscillospiraceae bacterium]
MNDSFISVKNVCFSYTDENNIKIPVLKNISFDVKKGEFVVILGHNGSGKSTMAKLLNLVLTPDSGRIVVGGIDITSEKITDDDVFSIRQRIGMVFQNPDNQIVSSIVEEDVAFGPENLGVLPTEIRKRVDNALAEVGMTEFMKHSPSQLSGGQKQRVAIAGIIAMLPECIVFDEATSMLDPSGRRDVMNAIEKLNKEKGITILHITHNMSEAVNADRVIVINDGQVCMDDVPKRVFSDVAKLHEIGLDVPQVTELIYELKNSGIELPCDIIDIDEGAEALASLLKKWEN